MREDEKKALVGLFIPCFFILFSLLLSPLATSSCVIAVLLFWKVGWPVVLEWRKTARVKK